MQNAFTVRWLAAIEGALGVLGYTRCQPGRLRAGRNVAGPSGGNNSPARRRRLDFVVHATSVRPLRTTPPL